MRTSHHLLMQPSRTRALFRWARILLAFSVCLAMIPVALALWVARGDPDIRLAQHSAYLSNVAGRAAPGAPNIVLVFADDLGYGDVASFGSKAIRTPHLDALASEGVRLSAFYSASPVCSPSRFSCLTGRYPTRGFIHSVFFPAGTAIGLAVNTLSFPRGIRGIPPDEITVAEALRAAGYRTGMFGKWHLGDRSPHLPTDKGFDYYFGSYYSNDMKPYAMYRNGEVALEAPVDQSGLTRTLTDEILGFIDRAPAGPFFIYYASPFPHDPAHASESFAGRSNAGTYGDCVEELDWSVGAIRDRLAERGLLENTLFVFTSDNGPWYEGSSGPHRGRKANSFEGGLVVPFIASWPGTIPASTMDPTPAMTIDLFPTFLSAAGLPVPDDRIVDGTDITPLLKGNSGGFPERSLFFVRGGEFAGVRGAGNLKYIRRHRSENSAYWIARRGPFLFDLAYDRDESYDVTARFPREAEELARSVARMNEARLGNPRGWLDPQ